MQEFYRLNNILVGNGGNDTLNGGAGVDNLSGGEGGDRFIFDIGRRFNRKVMGVDVITDFSRKQDKLIIDRTTFKRVRKISFDTVKNRREAKKSDAQFTYIRSRGALFFNQNGDQSGFGFGGQFVDLTDGLRLTAKNLGAVK